MISPPARSGSTGNGRAGTRSEVRLASTHAATGGAEEGEHQSDDEKDPADVVQDRDPEQVAQDQENHAEDDQVDSFVKWP